MKICSLLPGATEIIAALGMSDNLVGISHECDFPPEIKNKTVMVQAVIESDHTSSHEIDRQVKETLTQGKPLYILKEDLFTQLQPDLVITQDLCHVCAVTPDQLQQVCATLPHSTQLLSLNPTSLQDVLMDVLRIGGAIDRQDKAKKLVQSLRTRLQTITERVGKVEERPRVACVEWLDPLYIAGHWVPEMVDLASGTNVLGNKDAPSQTITWEDLEKAKPEVMVFMPCGFSIGRTLHDMVEWSHHPKWSTLPATRNGRVFAVDASSYFSRPGPRLIDGVEILAALLHPSLFGPAPSSQAQSMDLAQHNPSTYA